MSEQVNASGPMYRASHDSDQGIDRGTMRILIGAAGVGVVALLALGVYGLAGRGGFGMDRRRLSAGDNGSGGEGRPALASQAAHGTARAVEPAGCRDRHLAACRQRLSVTR